MVPWGVLNLFSFFCLSFVHFGHGTCASFERLFNKTPFWIARLMATFILGRQPKLWLKKVATLLSNFTSPSPSAYLSTASVPLMFTHQMTHTNTPNLPPIHPSLAHSLCCYVVGYMVVKHDNFAKITVSVCIWRGNGKICVFVLKMLKGECVCAQCGFKVLCEVTFWFVVC